MEPRYKNKHVIVTGGAQSIGFEICRQFCAEGAAVSIFDYNKKVLDEAVQQLTAQGYVVKPFHVDIAKQDQVIPAVEAAEKFAPIDVLVNNAGICPVTPFLNIEPEEWHRTMDINLTGAFYVAQAVCRFMAKRKKGVVINMASKNGMDGEFGHAHYNASKAGMILLTKTIAIELAHLDIRCNAVCPGYIRSAMNFEVDTDEFVAEFANRYIPLNRVGTVDKIAPLFLFLASDDASWITGQTFVVDGGQLAGQKAAEDLLQRIKI